MLRPSLYAVCLLRKCNNKIWYTSKVSLYDMYLHVVNDSPLYELCRKNYKFYKANSLISAIYLLKLRDIFTSNGRSNDHDYYKVVLRKTCIVKYQQDINWSSIITADNSRCVIVVS